MGKNTTAFRPEYTLRADATFSRYELACEKKTKFCEHSTAVSYESPPERDH